MEMGLQGLKPLSLSYVYPWFKARATNIGVTRSASEQPFPQRLKPRSFAIFLARLKPCPDVNHRPLKLPRELKAPLLGIGTAEAVP
jgi:hypothetical protein